MSSEKDTCELNDKGRRNKRIAKNSLVLFARILIITIINLFALRYVYNGLGEEDYGLFNAIAGLVLSGSFVVPVLAISIQRFYSFAKGRNEDEKQREIFSASINIIFFISLLIVILLETIGLWFLNSQMTIPGERTDTIQFVYQFAILSFIFSLFQIPFTAALFANEDMGTYAMLSSIDCAIKFIIAILIVYIPTNGIIYYSAALCVEAFVLFAVYAIICHYKYAECHYQYNRNTTIYKELLSFSGWTMYGALAATGMIQGSNILLNVFFGPIANAAFSVAYTMYNAFNSLNNSIVLSFRPAMVQSYAKGDYLYLNKLFSMNNKMLLYVIFAAALPILFLMDDILLLWLGETTSSTALFCRLFIIYGICLALHNPITTIIQSTGKILTYSLCVESITILNIPLSYLLFTLGCPAEGVFYSMTSLCIIAHIVRIICLKKSYSPTSIKTYITGLLLPAFFIIVINTLLTYYIFNIIHVGWTRIIVVLMTSPIITIVLVLLLGINSLERKALYNFALKKKN